MKSTPQALILRLALSLLAILVNPNILAQVPAILSQPENQVVPIGSSATFNVFASGTQPLTYRWFFGTQALAQASPTLNLINVNPSQAGEYSVVVSNVLGAVTSAPASLIVLPLLPGMLDPTFNTGSGANGVVRAITTDVDSRIYLGGEFSFFNGMPAGGVARLNPDGALDPSFPAGPGVAGSVYALAVQDNGQVVIGGAFQQVNGAARNQLARLNGDGTLDATFDAALGCCGNVWTITIQPDGKILIGGDFTSVGGIARNRIARLNVNGTLDTTFAPGTGMNDSVRSIMLQPNGLILAGGIFTTVNSAPRNRIVRLTSTGATDFGFNAGSGPDYWVNRIALQADGKVLLGGSFFTVNGVTRPNLARLNTNGTLDATFAADGGPSGPVTSIAVQTNGSILIGGGFSTVNEQTHSYIARLGNDGRIDESFFNEASASYWVESIALQIDGNILLGGAFQFVNGVYQGYIARLLGNNPAPFIPLITQQPTAQQTVGEGNNIELIARAVAFPSPTYQWQLNGTNLPGATLPTLIMNNVRITNAGSYRLVVSNSVGAVTSRVAVVNITPARTSPGAVDLPFFTGAGPNYIVRNIAIQPDGKTLIAGYFDRVNGLPGTNIARLNVDGSVDQTFLGSAPYGVNQIAALPSGSILIGGGFSYVNGVSRFGIAMLQTNGALNTAFNPAFFNYGSVSSFLVQTNGKVIIVGNFVILQNGSRTNFARLNLANGSLDTSLDAGFGANGQVLALAEHTLGRVLVGGDFNTFDGVPANNLVRLNPDGSVDSTFHAGSGPNVSVTAIAVQADGKIIIAGGFRAYNGVPRHGVARLNSDGTLDPSFDPGQGPDAVVHTIALQADGKVVIGGGFTHIAGFPRNRLGRLNADGSPDLTFEPGAGADAAVYSVAEIPFGPDAGKLMVGGAFLLFDSLPRPYLVRVLGGPAPLTPPAIIRHPASLTVQAGEDVDFSVLATGGADLRYQWQLGGTNIPDATVWTLTLHNVRASNAGPYTVTVSNALGIVTSQPATLTVYAPSREPGAPDINFYSGLGPNDRVHAIAVQTDGRIVIGGAFTEVNATPRNRIARLRSSGELDATFDPALGPNERIFTLAVQPDGKILAGGSFTKVSNLPRNRIARFETNGTVDASFTPVLGADAEVYAIAVHTNGSVLVGGRFASVNGALRSGLARLRSDGSLDASFSPMLSLGAIVYALAVQSDAKVLVGGNFFSVDGFSRTRTTRLNENGSLDGSFALGGASSTVTALGVQNDGKILLGGDFLFVDPLPRVRVARLETNGFVDTAFTNAAPNQTVNALLSQPDHRTVLGGAFTNLGAVSFVDEYGQIYTYTNYARYRIARLETNGVVDLTFAAGSGVQGGTGYIDEYGQLSDLTTVLALARDANGRILVGGDFTRVNGITRPYIARLFSRFASDAIVVHRGTGVVELFWDTGTLQVADNVTGPWSDVPNAESPLLYSTGDAQKFFRIQFN